MITEFCKILGVKEADVLGRSRQAGIDIARHVYFWLMYQSGYSYSKIGRLNGRNHATIMNSVKVVNNAIEVKDRQVLDVWDKVKHLRASKTEATELSSSRFFVCPNCNGRCKVVVFEDFLGLEPPEMDECEVCKGTGKIIARKVTRYRGNTIIITE